MGKRFEKGMYALDIYIFSGQKKFSNEPKNVNLSACHLAFISPAVPKLFKYFFIVT
jgi:hypothetical protein